MIHQQPDPAKLFDDLRAELDELKRTVRRGKPAPHFRDLADADLTKIAHGEVPTYDSTTGQLRPGSAGGVASIAWFNNSDGSMVGGYQEFDQLYTIGSTSWFECPVSGDKTRIRIVESGMLLLTWYGNGDDAFDMEMTAGSNGIVTKAFDLTGSGATGSALAPFDLAPGMGYPSPQDVRVQTPGAATIVYGQLGIEYSPGTPTFSSL